MSTPEGEIARIGLDPDAFEAFYRLHVEAVQRFVARRVDDPHVAADLTTEVFLAAIDSAKGYNDAKGAPIAWLFGISRNVMANEVRRRERERRTTRKLAGRRELEPDALARIDSRIAAEQTARTLYRGLAELPDRDRALVELIAVDGLSVNDAAAALGVTPGNARVRLHRSRIKLRSLSLVSIPDLLEVTP